MRGHARRETDTMDTVSWIRLGIFCALRALTMTHAMLDLSRPILAARLPVNIAVRHAILHLLYARFLTRFMTEMARCAVQGARSRVVSRRAWC